MGCRLHAVMCICLTYAPDYVCCVSWHVYSLEYLTPLAPQHFLLLASLANVGKSIGKPACARLCGSAGTQWLLKVWQPSSRTMVHLHASNQ
jgi:hypothetical protein